MDARNKKLLIFAGTIEGRMLCEKLSSTELDITASVATDYGFELLSKISNISVVSGRLEADEMCEIIKNEFSMVVDATHPFANIVTENIKLACKRSGAQYVRLLRSQNDPSGVTTVSNMEAAARYLDGTSGNVLATTGSKELHHLCYVEGYQERLYVRVLPSGVSVCKQLGFNDGHIIGMQGPFSEEMNVALLKQLKCRYLLTKNTGTAGGLENKLIAAERCGAQVIMIDRPPEADGYSFDPVCDIISRHFNISLRDTGKQAKSASRSSDSDEKKEYFPLFVPSRSKKVLVIGGGAIAERRVKTLLRFEFEVYVIAISVTDSILRLGSMGKIKLMQKAFDKNDITLEYDYLLVATDSRDLNSKIGKIAKGKSIPVNVADCKEECDFFFPAVIIHQEAVVGLTCGGKSHSTARYVADKIRNLFDENNN